MFEAFIVPDGLDGVRVDRAISTLTALSRADVQRMLTSGLIEVDGRSVTKSTKLGVGQRVTVTGTPAEPGPPGPQPIDLDIRYEDDDVLIVHKPFGLVVHPGAGHVDGTLVNALLAFDPAIADVGQPARPGIVHRLDRDTSGLMMVARSHEAYDGLVKQLKARRVTRGYRSLVWGVLAEARGVIEGPIGRDRARRTRMAVVQDGRPARTHYRVDATSLDGGASELALRLETGRTHQIRVHLASIGHPVVGDPMYGGRRGGDVGDRLRLHSEFLSFAHPVTGETVERFADPPLDFAADKAALGFA